MALCLGLVSLVAMALLSCAAAADGAPADDELVFNSDFSEPGEANVPAGWSVWKPTWGNAACEVRAVEGGLRVRAPRKPYAVGGAEQECKGVEGGRAYAVEAVCMLRGMRSAYRSVHVRIEWLSEGKPVHPAGMLVRGPSVEGSIGTFEDVLIAPQEADAARIRLEVKWPRGGVVTWKRVSVRPTAMPPARKVKVGTVYLLPRKSTSERNLELWCEQIDAAGDLGLDIVCLGEAIRVVGTGADLTDCAEPIPGPSTERLGQAARKNRIWVVAGLIERDGDAVYNTAVLLDRKGKLAGTYRKVHLPREEWRKGITPGDAYPVFETDFGTIAIQICYDWFFPEPAEIFALKGAQIIFAPTWGNTLPDREGRVDGESAFRVRARDNGVYMVPSVYSGNSLVIDPLGRILASSDGRQGVFWAEVDLSARDALEWVGYWRSIGPRHRMPDTYGPLMEELQGPTY